MEKYRKWILPGVCVVGSILLYVILTVTQAGDGGRIPDGRLRRESFSGEEQTYQLKVFGVEDGLRTGVDAEVDGEVEGRVKGGAEDQGISLEVIVEPQQYTKEQAEDVFYQIMDKLPDIIKGDNPSLMEVSKDLSLPTRQDEYGVGLRWYSSDPEILSSAGRVVESVKEAKEATLFVQLSHGDFHSEFEIPVRLIPPQRTPLEEKLENLKEQIKLQEEEQRESEFLQLPKEVDGTVLEYQMEDDTDYSALPVLGILIGILLVAKEESDKKNKEKEREQELLLDYAEVVSKLMVFVGAGMTVRNAWDRIVKDYEIERKAGKKRAAYEEMCITCYQLQNGTSEAVAFREFGRRCKLQPYLKLSSLLEQNRKSGNKNLRMILETEMTDAFELRKNLARQMGEEAGTKLLMPLFLMLGIVMVMIMVPAMMTMG